MTTKENLKQVDQAVIQHISAILFWKMACEAGIGEAITITLESKGDVLFQQAGVVRATAEAFAAYGIRDRSEYDISAAVKSIKEHCVSSISALDTFLGSFSQIEIAQKISSALHFINAFPLNTPPRELQIEGDLHEIGDLCVRTPLPSVCIANEKTDSRIIKIKSTKRSLGFEYPMFMLLPERMEISEGLYCYSGMLYIPCKEEELFKKWDMIIPNSNKFIDGTKLYLGDSTFSIRAEWSQPIDKGFIDDSSASSLSLKISPAILNNLFTALEFLVSLEPSPHSENGIEEYRSNIERNQENHDKCVAILQSFARLDALGRHLSLCEMQSIYYAISNSDDFGSKLNASVAASHLKSAWKHIGEWKN